MNNKRIVIASCGSGSGKTIISTGIMGALYKKGLKVQGFKIGPDYIDTTFHEKITKRNSRNLDAYLMNEDTLKYLYYKNSSDADISIIEGVMGLYDGYGKTSFASTAHCAKILKAPVILVMDIKGMSLSSAAVVKGFVDFDKDIDIKGIILNKIKTKSQFEFFKSMIEENTKINVLGFLPQIDDLNIKSRHLGLFKADEIKDFDFYMENIIDNINKNIDLNTLLDISSKCDNIVVKDMKPEKYKNYFKGIKIAVPFDNAFNFYYKDNFELMEYMGCEIEFFNSFSDNILKDICGIYIGGGYPELYAKELSENKVLLNSIKTAAENNMPVYGECGGLMYIMEYIDNYKMTGCIKGSTAMGKGLKHFGYVCIDIEKDCILGKKGQSFKAHEFHYSYEATESETAFNVSKSKGMSWKSGYIYKNVLASYPHIHFWSEPQILANFLQSCKNYKNKREV